MKSNIVCKACGKRRKSGHEKRCGTPKAYNERCETYEVCKEKINKEKAKTKEDKAKTNENT